VDLSTEAIRLARLVHGLVPKDPEATGLLALMLLTDARREARTGSMGEAIPLDRQDRSLWNRALIGEGVELVSAALKHGGVGPYQLQAAIAALHDEAPSTKDTDWPQILTLYDMLAKMSENPMVLLNRAVAVAMVHGPEAGLKQLPAIDHYRLDAVRGHLFEMAGDREQAIQCYQSAAQRTASLPERNYLLTRAAQLRN
jgi:predicted RNA polymerase sigma factor